MSRQLCLGILWLLGASVAVAQVRMAAQESTFVRRPISLREGETIVNTALERERQTTRRPDCSHLVHEVYTLAGYPYSYADSFDLYVGTGGFVRVVEPQPGDLVVWRGHVGIVVDPAEHSFYSSLNSGLRTESYYAPEWRARGPARFYRYAAATLESLTPRMTQEPAQVITARPVEKAVGDSSRTKETAKTVAPDLELPSSSPAFEIPSSIFVAAARDRPTHLEIAEAVSELNNGTGNLLREDDLSRLDRKVIVYDHLSVERIAFKGNRGSAQARINSRVTLLGERIQQRPHYEVFRWELLRVNGGWVVLVPKDRVYVPLDVAVRMLAERLASLAQYSGLSGSDSSFRQQAQIVHVLNALFEEKP